MRRIRTDAERARLNFEQAAVVARALLESGPAERRSGETPGARTLEEARQLRGIPVVGVRGGLGGAITGSRPGERLGSWRPRRCGSLPAG